MFYCVQVVQNFQSYNISGKIDMKREKDNTRDLNFDDKVVYVSPEGISYIRQAIDSLEKAQIELKKAAVRVEPATISKGDS